MNKKVAILRGINVGGKRKVLMNDLKLLCRKIGWMHVETYIQSGNVIFDSDHSNAQLEEGLEQAIEEQYGFDVPVIVRSSSEIKALIDKNPFYDKDVDIIKLHLTFLKDSPTNECIEKAKACVHDQDQFEVVDKNVFIRCEGKYHQSRLTNAFFEKNLKLGATTRNWKTVLKLKELCE
ncbi:DUF1697 domain-containing protein [Carboxylicivirga sp. RSCT41]|uniref:DUF1697 domain-containing protein n=1 Tax=Carboxylicivirga agarovorans TaxID=3417570 RepID=UPI003D343EE0